MDWHIGIHMVWMLSQHGRKVTTFDDFPGGYRDVLLVGDFVDWCHAKQPLLKKLYLRVFFRVVMHFGSFIRVENRFASLPSTDVITSLIPVIILDVLVCCDTFFH